MIQSLGKDQIDSILKEDALKCGNYRYAAVSFASSEARQKIDDHLKCAVKIRGAFGSKKEAFEHVKILHEKGDTAFDVYIVDMYKFVLLGNIGGIEDTNHTMADMVIASNKRAIRDKEMFEKRKEIVKKHGLEKDPDAIDPVVKSDVDPPAVDDDDVIPILDSSDVTQSPEDAKVSMMSDVCKYRVGGCEYFLISYLQKDTDFQELQTPSGVIALKIRGVYGTKETAEQGAKELSELDNEHDIFVVEGYKWLLLPNEALETNIETKYNEPFLNSLFESYDENRKKADAFITQVEKDAAMQNPALETNEIVQ